MKKIIVLILSVLSFSCNSQIKSKKLLVTVSPMIDQQNQSNKEIISVLTEFLKTKNNSLTENEYWLKSDFEKFIYPYSDIFNIENSKYGKDFFNPTLVEIIATDDTDKKIIKIAFIGHNPETNENQLKSIYNIIANKTDTKIVFSSYLPFITHTWKEVKTESITYKISPNKEIVQKEIEQQQNEIVKLSKFFNTKQIPITYFSCTSPKEIFEIKGFDYNPMMFIDKSGGLAEHGNIIFSGNNSEIYTHEIVHIYTNAIFPKISKFFDEGMATLIAGSGNFNYDWHRSKFKKFLNQNQNFNFKEHFNPYERLYFENETSVPYMISALICERTLRIYNKEKLFEMFKSEKDIWEQLKIIGLNEQNINSELFKEINYSKTEFYN